ncbi:MAG: AtpZ/AtpI family protein [Cyclobacteriaceae bacterium]
MRKSNKNLSSSKHNPDQSPQSGYISFVGIAFEVAAINLLFIWGGIALDDKFPSISPTFLIAGVVLATVATIYYLLAKLNRNK